MDAAIALVRPGATTADICAVWPAAQQFGFADEEAAFALQYGHGVGLSIWERPIFSRLISFEHPEVLEEGMVFALETYWPASDGWSATRIEEEVVVTADGCEIVTKFPAEDLLVCGQRYWTIERAAPRRPRWLASTAARMRPFRFELPHGAVDDLRRRLAATRWPDAEPVDDRSQGVPLADLRELCRYWAEDYEWPAAVARINAMPQFVADIGGLDVHAAHVRSPHDDALPLLMTHGWPGSFLEFAGRRPPPRRPRAWAATPPTPSTSCARRSPGSPSAAARPSRAGDRRRTAAAWRRLMTALGTRASACRAGTGAPGCRRSSPPRRACGGTHLNFVLIGPDPETMGDLTDDERRALDDVAHMDRWGHGYFAQQMTRPQTVGYGLNDSPAGLSAWIVRRSSIGPIRRAHDRPATSCSTTSVCTG